MKRVAAGFVVLVLLAGCATPPPFKAGDYVMPRSGERFADNVSKIQIQLPPEGDTLLIYGKEWKVSDLQLAPPDPVAVPKEAASLPPASTAVPPVAEKPAEKPVEPPAVTPAPAAVVPAVVEKPAEKPVEKPVEKPAEKPVEKAVEKPAEQPAAPAATATQETKIKNAAAGATVTASSVNKKFPNELPASALVDGDLTTRWSSEYADPQTVEVKLEKPLKIAKIRLHWENAVATKYALSVSSDGKKWNGMHAYLKTDAKPEARVDEINLNNISAQYIKLDLLSRVKPDWGFSLYEIEVVAAD